MKFISKSIIIASLLALFATSPSWAELVGLAQISVDKTSDARGQHRTEVDPHDGIAKGGLRHHGDEPRAMLQVEGDRLNPEIRRRAGNVPVLPREPTVV
jgi:hypothetical protein